MPRQRRQRRGRVVGGTRRLLASLVVAPLLALSACGEARPPDVDLRPLPGATTFREELACDPIIHASLVDLLSFLRKDFGRTSVELLETPRDADWKTIVSHYAGQLPQGWRSLPYPADHAHYRLQAWSDGQWPPRYLAVALLDEAACPEDLPYRIMMLAVPGDEFPRRRD